jgi:aminobenzoyl-glutamate transport protein
LVTKAINSLLNGIEKAGNKLPDPITLFFIFIAVVIGASVVLDFLNVNAEHPITGEVISVSSLISKDNIQRILTEMPQTFASFPPLGLVLLVMLGAGVAEKSGFFGAAFGALVKSVPGKLLTPTLLLMGVLSSLAVDAGYVILVPLGASLFLAAGRHPLVGLAVAFAGVAGAVTANLFPTPLDALLGGISEDAARIIDPSYDVPVTANYYFMLALTPILVIAGTLTTRFFVEARLAPYDATRDDILPPPSENPPESERRALHITLTAALTLLCCILFLAVPERAFLRTNDGNITPFLHSIAAIMALSFLALGILYGAFCGKIKSDRDVIKMASSTMSEMGSYIVLAFAAAHFIAFFNWSNLALVISIKSAAFLSGLSLTGFSLLLAVILVTSVTNLFIGSASAKWATLSAILVPMMMIMGISPEATQNAYRIGDSVTNIISPLFPYLPLILIFGRRYVNDFGIGTLVTLMLPYSFVFSIISIFMIVLWYFLDLPLGPGSYIFIQN